MPTTTFDFSSGVVVADTDFSNGSTTRQATQTIGANTLTVALDSASGANAVVMDDVDFFGGDVLNLNGNAFETTFDAFAGSLTLSLDSGKIFDLTGINIFDENAVAGVTYIFTTTKGSVQETVDLTQGAAVLPLSDAKLQGVTSVVITQQGGQLLPAVDDIKLANIMSSNITPTFVGPPLSLTVAQNGTSSAGALAGLLHVSDTDSGQTETWTASVAPLHGAVTFSGATAASGSTNITAGGTMTYTPEAGFAGVDTFTVQVSDGAATATRVISVNVKPATPGAPDLAAGSDSGPALLANHGADNITNAATLNFSGSSGAGDTSSTVQVFLDQNSDGVFDPGEPTATATIANGSWTVTGLSTTGVSDGDYNVYAKVTSATGSQNSVNSSPLVVHIDKTAPTETFSNLQLSADTGSSSGDFVTKTAAQTISTNLSSALSAGEAVYGSLDGGTTWTDLTSTIFGTSVTWTGVTLSGSGTLEFKVIDAAGNESPTFGQAYVLDTTAPTQTFSGVSFSADTGGSSTDLVTRTAAQTVHATLSGALAGGDILYGSLDNGNSWTNITSKVSGTSVDWNGVTLASSDTLQLKVVDAAGNEGHALSVAYVFDTTAPSVPSAIDMTSATDTGASSTDHVTQNSTPVITGAADTGATITLYDTDGFTVLGTTTAVNGAWSITSAPLSETSHTLTAQATDLAGNASGASSGLTVEVDQTAAAVTITTGSASLHAGETTTVTFAFTEAVSGFTTADLTVDNGVLSNLASTDGGTTWTATLTPTDHVVAGVNHIVLDNAGVQDLAGNSGMGTTDSASYAIDTVTQPSGPTPPDTTPPEPPVPPVIIVATPGGNIVTGDPQNNTITPSGGADTVSAGGGDDTVGGGAHNDVLQGNTGDDSLAAGAGSDVVYGGQGADHLQGNAGGDVLSGDKGNDQILGGQGDDTAQGGEDNDYVSGDLGDDVLRGGKGDDVVLGGDGNDFLSGDLGNNTLTGGAGADTFHSFGGAGMDLVTDFNRAEGDRIVLDPGTHFTTTQVGGDVHIDMVGGGEVILVGVQLSTLSGDWIVA